MLGLRVIAVLAALVAPAMAYADARATQSLTRLFDTSGPSEDLFAPGFIAAVPLYRISSVVDDMRATIGPVQEVAVDGQALVLRSRSHVVHGQIALDDDGRIAMLRFDAPVRVAGSLSESLAPFADMAPDVSWLVRGEAVLADSRSDVALPVGSAFKLGVLARLRRDIEDGQRRWDDVVHLAPVHRSHPSGRLHLLRDDAPVTLHTAAAQMIAESDNTATDLLIDTLGADRIADVLGVAALPTTREYFWMKADAGLRDAWTAGAHAEVSASVRSRPLPPLAQVVGPVPPGLGCPVSLRRLCDVMSEVADLELMAINPGPVTPADWQVFAFKGGSDAGLLNMTAHLEQGDGRAYCVSVTLYGEQSINEDAAVARFRTVLATLKQEVRQ